MAAGVAAGIAAAAETWSFLSDEIAIPSEQRITLQQDGLDLEDSLRFLLAETGLHLVTADSLPNSSGLAVSGATLPEVFEILARRHDLSYRLEGEAVVLDREESRTFRVDYLGNPEAPFWTELQAGLEPLLGAGGTAALSPRTGTVTVVAPPRAAREVGRYLRALERALENQVDIEAKIVEVSLDDAFRMGVDWTVFEDGWEDVEGNTSAGGLFQLRSRDDMGGVFQMGLLRTDKLDLLIELLEQQGSLHIISRPRVAAMGNEPAVFRMTENVPYYEIEVITTEGSQPYVQYDVAFREAGVILEVLAQVGDDETITLGVHPSVSTVTGYTESLPNLPPQPIIDTRETETSVRLRQDQTLVIGGMIQTLESERTDGLPVLSHLPYIGGLFRRTVKEEQRRELVVLLSPRVLRDDRVESYRHEGHRWRFGAAWSPRDLRGTFAAHEHNRALEAFRAGDLDQALARAEQAFRLEPEPAEIRMNLGFYRAQAGRFEEARQIWRQLAREDDALTSDRARANLLALDATEGRDRGQAGHLLESAEDPWVRAATYLNLAALRVALGDAGGAREVLLDGMENLEGGDSALWRTLERRVRELREGANPDASRDDWSRLEALSTTGAPVDGDASGTR